MSQLSVGFCNMMPYFLPPPPSLATQVCVASACDLEPGNISLQGTSPSCLAADSSCLEGFVGNHHSHGTPWDDAPTSLDMVKPKVSNKRAKTSG